MWSRPKDDESMKADIFFTTNLKYTKDDKGILAIDENLPHEERGESLFQQIIGMPNVDLLNDPTLINVVYSPSLRLYGIVKTDEDYQVISSFISSSLVKHLDMSIYDAMQDVSKPK